MCEITSSIPTLLWKTTLKLQKINNFFSVLTNYRQAFKPKKNIILDDLKIIVFSSVLIETTFQS